jgi:putative heme iron utilization protein
VNPSVEDPSKFIEFREYLPVGIDSEGRGAETIRILGLDREAMNTLRRDHMQTMKRMVRAIRAMEQIEQTPDIVEAMRELNLQIAEWVSDNAQYAAMCRAIFRAPIDR